MLVHHPFEESRVHELQWRPLRPKRVMRMVDGCPELFLPFWGEVLVSGQCL